jgi:hypothetical protein
MVQPCGFQVLGGRRGSVSGGGGLSSMADGSASVGAGRLRRTKSVDDQAARSGSITGLGGGAAGSATARPQGRRGSAATVGAGRLQASASLDSGTAGITRGRRSSAVGVTRGRRGSAIGVAAAGRSQDELRTMAMAAMAVPDKLEAKAPAAQAPAPSGLSGVPHSSAADYVGDVTEDV